MSCGYDGKQTIRKGQQENKDQQKIINVCIGTLYVCVHLPIRNVLFDFETGDTIFVYWIIKCLQFMSDEK